MSSTTIPKPVDVKKSRLYKLAMKAEKNNPHFKFYKASPDTVSIKLGNCAVRAIATAENVSYEDAEKELLENLREIGYGYYAYNDSDYLNKKYEKETFKPVKGEKRLTGKTFAESHPKGRYVLHMAHHMTACIDGVIYDTWDCTNKAITASWRVSNVL